VTLQAGLFLLELLCIDTGETLAPTPAPRTGDLARMPVEIGDDLARPVTWYALAWLMRLLCHGIALAILGGG
jgi:hypothetical protein